MKRKTIATLLLTTAFAAGAVMPAFADVTPMAAPAEILVAAPQEQAYYPLVMSAGTVQDILQDGNDTSVLVKTAQTEIRFTVADTTWLVDANGLPTTLEGLKGKEVFVAHSEAMTMSLPAISNAAAIMEQGSAAPNYAVIEAVTKNTDGSYTFTTNGGSRQITVDDKTTVAPYKTRNIVKAQDLQVGDEVVFYYDVLMESYPAQAYATKAVQLVSSPMVCLRDVANQQGLRLSWNGETQTVTVTGKSGNTAMVTVGSRVMAVGQEELAVESLLDVQLKDGRTYIPQAFAEALRNL